MKKLMIAAAIVCAAAFAQAASANWNSGTINVASDATGTTGSTAAGKGGVTAYLFSLAAADYATVSAMSTTELYNKYIGGGVSPVKSTTTGLTGAANIKQTGLPDGSGDLTQTAYGVVLYVDTTTAASFDGVDAFVKSYVGMKQYQDTTGPTFSGLAATQSKWTAISSVPEPTSGLLLLLGVAGLALRRRRA